MNELIEKANAQFEERNARALERGEEALPQMLPLIRLKVQIRYFSMESSTQTLHDNSG